MTHFIYLYYFSFFLEDFVFIYLYLFLCVTEKGKNINCVSAMWHVFDTAPFIITSLSIDCAPFGIFRRFVTSSWKERVRQKSPSQFNETYIDGQETRYPAQGQHPQRSDSGWEGWCVPRAEGRPIEEECFAHRRAAVGGPIRHKSAWLCVKAGPERRKSLPRSGKLPGEKRTEEPWEMAAGKWKWNANELSTHRNAQCTEVWLSEKVA